MSTDSTPASRHNISPYAQALTCDHYYHLGLDTDMDLKALFGDVKYFVMMGSPMRAETFAEVMANAFVEQGLPKPTVMRLGKTERYSMFKCGSVVSVSHGMGGPSLHILMNEVCKLCNHVGIIDTVKWIRLGTSGGCGVAPGTVVCTTQAINDEIKPCWRTVQLGKVFEIPTDVLDMQFVDDIIASAPEDIPVVKGKTMAADDFFEGQGRTDGALTPWYKEQDKIDFIHRLHDAGVRNIEMESVALMGFCQRAKIPAACVCVTLVNRLEGDQITSTKRQLAKYNEYSIRVVSNYIATTEAKTAPNH